MDGPLEVCPHLQMESRDGEGVLTVRDVALALGDGRLAIPSPGRPGSVHFRSGCMCPGRASAASVA